jgi:DNA (cytosine-5)-methyltransferase 1
LLFLKNQSHSFCGKRLGLNDVRGTLIYDLFRVIKETQPIFCVLENVKGIKSSNDGKTFQLIHSICREIGYDVINRLTNPKEINIPQNRERYVFILINKKYSTSNINGKIFSTYYQLINERKLKNINYKVVEKNPPNPKTIPHDIELAIDIWNDLLRRLNGKRCSRISPNNFKVETSYKNKDYKNKHILEMNKFYNDNKTVIDSWWVKHYHNFVQLKSTLKSLEWNTGVDFCSTTNIYDYYIQVRQSGLRIKKNTIFPTLVKSGTPPIIGKYKRYLTPKECGRLQSFPDNYKFLNDTIVYQQLGNSVNVEIMEIVIRSVLIVLGFYLI